MECDFCMALFSLTAPYIRSHIMCMHANTIEVGDKLLFPLALKAIITIMATSTSGGNDRTANHPSMQLWNKLYKEQKDEWTSEAVDTEVLMFHDIVTNGKIGLDILVPMCGRSKIMLSFADKGHRIVGIEWSELAVKQFFEENCLEYTTQPFETGGIQMLAYHASNKAITIYCGDLFAFKDDNLGGFDCILDHGSIGSFDNTMAKRIMYAKLMTSFTKPGGRVLLSIFDYEHAEHPTIPFAVTEEQVVNLYQQSFQTPKLLQTFDATKFTHLFNLHPGTLFPVWALSRFAWKILLLVKQ